MGPIYTVSIQDFGGGVGPRSITITSRSGGSSAADPNCDGGTIDDAIAGRRPIVPIVDATAALQYDPLTTRSRSSLPALPEITDWSWELENRGNVKASDVGLRMGVKTRRAGCGGRTVDIMEPSAGITSERPVSDACTD